MEELELVECVGTELLHELSGQRGILWENISKIEKLIQNEIEDSVSHIAGEEQSEEMKELFPLKQHIEGGLYTREIFMPKGSFVVSMIHKQDHPSFLLKGKLSYINDQGQVEHIQGPTKIFTKQGTQRVLYIHEDCEWCCVYKTDALTFEEAEADVYTNDYKELPIELINKNKLLWQD